MSNFDLKFYETLTKKDSKPFNAVEFFSGASFAKAANSPMEMAAKDEGWKLPDLKPPQAMGLPDMKMGGSKGDLSAAKPNMFNAMSNTQKPVQQAPNNPTGVSGAGQGFTA
jgi:hypothetical protein